MRSKISCFNSTMVRHDIRRYWPLWAACLFFCVIFLPLFRLYNPGWSSFASLTQNGWVLELAVTAVFSALIAMAVFSPLYHTETSGFYAALPVRREVWFASAWLSGFFMLVGCALLTALLMFGVELSCGDVELGETLLWVGKYILLTVFFYGLASLCALLTGTLWVVPLLYGVVNFIAYLLWVAVCYICEMLTTGWVSPEDYLAVWLTPLLKISETEGKYELWILILYAVLGLLFAALAFRIMKKRKMENATDIVAVRVLKPLFRWAGGLCSGLFMGVILYAVFWDTSKGRTLQMMLFALVGVIVGWFGAEMLNRRSFKVWKKLPGFFLCAALVLGFIFCCGNGCFGYESYIPKEDSIVRVECDDYSRGWGVSSDREDIRAFVELHGDIRRKETEDGHTVDLTYTLKNGDKVKRRYTLRWEDFTAREQSLLLTMELNGLSERIKQSADTGVWYWFAEWFDGTEYHSLKGDAKRFAELLMSAIQDGTLEHYQGEADNVLEIYADSYYDGRSSGYRFHVTEEGTERIRAYFD